MSRWLASVGLVKLWNNIPGNNKAILWVQGAKHGYVPPNYEGRDFRRGKKAGDCHEESCRDSL